MAKKLYEGRFLPLTSEIGFLQCGVEAVVKAFALWQECIQVPRGVEIEVSRTSCESLDQIQVPEGFGARWVSDGSFIGFINP